MNDLSVSIVDPSSSSAMGSIIGFSSLWWAVTLTFSIFWRGTTAASFYGSSYVRLPLEDAKSTTEIHLRFKTHRSDAFLFFAAGSTDYCLLLLESGGLKVRINLGAGESELITPQGLRLDDLVWHTVDIKRIDANLSLTVDGLLQSKLTIPGRFYELNIHYGLFVGGTGDFRELFLGIMESYRGCIDDLHYNGIDVFKQVKELSDQQFNVHMVSWDCNPIFESTSDKPFSLIPGGSFLTFATMSARNSASFSCDLKTQVNTSTLLYNTGIPSESDFIAVEIVNGQIRLAIDKGNGLVELLSESSVNDGLWHHVEIRFGDAYMEVNVDDDVTSIRPSLGENRHLDLVGPMYVGGVELNRRARAVTQGLISMQHNSHQSGDDGTFKGCLLNLKVNDVTIGLREAQVTHGVKVNCVWDYPCLRSPCIPEATCIQEGMEGFRCFCDSPSCVKTDYNSGYKVYTSSNDRDGDTGERDVEILQLQPLQVKEGATELITSNHIDVVYDFNKYDLRESAILFHVINGPKHGQLEVDVWRRTGANQMFTLMDINNDKVRYTHDGSENHRDSVTLELEFLTRSKKSLESFPEFFHQKHRFVFHVSILSVNDPPEIRLSSGRVLRLAKNSRKSISPDFLSTLDPDNDAKDLLYTVLATGSEGEGHLENSRYPGKAAESFTQEDIDNGLISYVHQGNPNARVALKVSDGKETAPTAVLRISAYQLEIHMVNNTGITVTYNSFSIISVDNLTFATNALELDQNVRYDITRLSKYGQVQLLRHGGHWQTVNHFTQLNLINNKIRYQHTSGSPKQDDFKFTVTCNGVTSSVVYDFRITFTKNNVEVVNLVELQLDKVQEGVIGPEHLRAETFPHPTDDGSIFYVLTSLPRYGSLLVTNPSDVSPTITTHHRREHHHQRPQKITNVGSNFTQEDIKVGHVRYRLHHKSYSAIRDSFEFKVTTNDASSQINTFKINHQPFEFDKDAGSVVVGILEVSEGEQTIIDEKALNLRIPGVDVVHFKVIKNPRCGKIDIQGRVQKHNASFIEFDSNDIRNGKVYYVHDDSENDRDEIEFLAITSKEDIDGPEFQFVGTIPVRVIMKNDMQPERVVDKVFHVVTNGQKIITSKDLRFTDADLGTLPADLQYTRRGMPNGAIYHMDHPPESQIFQFTQQDIDDGKILFRHSGASFGKAAFWVSDGKYFVNGVLEVRASDPFVAIANNSGLIVKRGDVVIISSANLSIDTNIDAKLSDIHYLVSVPPGHGIINLDGQPATKFTQEDIAKGRVTYRSDGSHYFGDNFNFEAHLFETRSDGNLEIRIYPESYWEPLEVSGNWTVTVAEGQRVTIDPTQVLVNHPNVDPHEITFIVKKPPQHGYLANDVNLDMGADLTTSPNLNSPQFATTIFDQATINERRVKYVHTERNATEDIIVVDVTNGIITIDNLELTIEVIPSKIYLKTKTLLVKEGESVVLNVDAINVANKHFQGKVKQFIVQQPPKHGQLVIKTAKDDAKHSSHEVHEFTMNQLQDQTVKYIHDGSETVVDQFVIVANSKTFDEQKSSVPAVVQVLISPVNDEKPIVTKLNKLEVWQGSTTVVSSNYIEAKDNDTANEDLIFKVVSLATNGYFCLSNKTKERLTNFSQTMINQGKVSFVHTGEATGFFKLQLTDGIHVSAEYSFHVLAKPVTLNLHFNNKLYVFPSLQQTITWRHLLAAASNWDSERVITFGLREGGPRLGKIVRLNDDGSVREVNSFTQDHVNRSLIAYKHTKPMSELVATDSFAFDIKCSNAETIKNVVFQIEISVVTINPDGLEHYVNVSPIVTDEGGFVDVTQKHLNTTRLSEVLIENRNSRFIPRLIMIFNELPLHGVVTNMRDSTKFLANVTEFNQSDVNGGIIRYTHDHSDTLEDRAIVGVQLDNSGIQGGAIVMLLNITLSFRILPKNDQNFELITTAPRIEVVRGQTIQILPSILKTVDADTIPKDILYDIISGPSDGRVVLKPNFSKGISSFTQQDVDDGRLWYVHSGLLDTASFHFKVSDGSFKPVYTVFNVHVVHLTLELTNNTAIEIPQGTTSTYLRSNSLGAQSNGNRSHIWYNVTEPPRHGHLFMDDIKVYQFSQNDIDQEKVLYVQMNMSLPADQFVVTIWNEDNRLEHQLFSVVVQPLIKKQKKIFKITTGSREVVTLDVLDASQLAEKTKSNPVFIVTAAPKFGRLRWVRRRNSQTKRDSTASHENEVSRFTHEDVVNGVIAYETRDFKTHAVVNDSFEYLLITTGVQPARGILWISIHPKSSVYYPTNHPVTPHTEKNPKNPNVPPGSVPPTSKPISEVDVGKDEDLVDPPVIKSNFTTDHFLIIALAIGGVLLMVMLGLVIKCAVLKKAGKKPPKCSATRSTAVSSASNGGPLPLPPPTFDGPEPIHYQCVPNCEPPVIPEGHTCIHYDDDDGMIDMDSGSQVSGRGLTPPGMFHSSRSLRPTSPRLRSQSHSSIPSRTDPSVSSLRATPLAIAEEDWSEVSVGVPMCKVTPLASQGDQLDTNETTLKYPYSYMEPGSVDSWGMYDPCSELPYSRTTNPMLRKNQYWV